MRGGKGRGVEGEQSGTSGGPVGSMCGQTSGGHLHGRRHRQNAIGGRAAEFFPEMVSLLDFRVRRLALVLLPHNLLANCVLLGARLVQEVH